MVKFVISLQKIYLFKLLVLFGSCLLLTQSKATSSDLLSAIAANSKVVQPSPYQPLLLSDLDNTLSSEGLYLWSGDLGTTKMGNLLSMYFELMACSDITRVHFVYRAVIKGDEPTKKFFGTFPLIRLHPDPAVAKYYVHGHEWRKNCPGTYPFPHKWVGAWNQRPAMIAEILQTAIKAVYPDVSSATIPVRSLSRVMFAQNQTVEVLPLVPSAAILFRCVDILHAPAGYMYGFVNFNAYAQLIPQNATTIYILTEPLNYLDLWWSAQNQRHCKEIGDYLVAFLHKVYPASTVALRRGYPLESFVMQATAATLISAPSTFSLYPGIANPNHVYLMPGLLFLDKPYLHDNFKWITSPALIHPGATVDVGKDSALNKIIAILTAPLEEAVHAAVGPL